MTDKPMREPTFLVLTALAGEPRHGYAVIEDVASLTGGRVRLRAGTLYAALDRLRAEGLIEVDREEIVQSRLRRYYRLSATGERALATESERLRRQATIAQQRLKTRRATFGAAATRLGIPHFRMLAVRRTDPSTHQAACGGLSTSGPTTDRTAFGFSPETHSASGPTIGRTMFGFSPETHSASGPTIGRTMFGFSPEAPGIGGRTIGRTAFGGASA